MTKIRKKDLHFTIMRLRERVNHYGVGVNDNSQEIKNILRTLRLHGEGHMANDLTPQFRKLCERVEKLESENEAALKAHGTRGLEITIILKRLETLELQLKNLLPAHHNVCDKVLAHDRELEQLRKAARLQGQHIVEIQKKKPTRSKKKP